MPKHPATCDSQTTSSPAGTQLCRAMRLRVFWLATAALVGLDINSVSAQDSIQLSGSATLASDYVHRGISQTLSKPALQLSVAIEHENGLFGWLWASNVDYVKDGDPDDGINQEINLVAGYQRALNEQLAVEFSALHFMVGGATDKSEQDFTEWTAAIVADDKHRVEVSYAPDAWGTGEPSWHYGASTSWPVLRGIDATLKAGTFDLVKVLGDSYLYGSVALTRETDSQAWSLSYHTTAGTNDDVFYKSTTSSRLVVSLEFFF